MQLVGPAVEFISARTRQVPSLQSPVGAGLGGAGDVAGDASAFATLERHVGAGRRRNVSPGCARSVQNRTDSSAGNQFDRWRSGSAPALGYT